MRFWSLVVSPFHGVRVAFSSRTVPQGSQVTQKFLPLKIASLAILAALLVAVASVFFFCFARPPLFPQGENRKMFLTAKKFYKNILERQKSHPAIKPSGCVRYSYCCVLMYSSNCPRRVTRRRSISERGQGKRCEVRCMRPHYCRERRKSLSRQQRLRNYFFATCFKEVSSFSRISSAFNACVLSVSLQNNSQY